jgi:hypothetical protein
MQGWQEAAAQLTPAEWLSTLSTLVAFVAAMLAIYAARIKIRDNVDAFIADLARQSAWNGRAAAANIVAGALIFAAAAMNVLEKVS